MDTQQHLSLQLTNDDIVRLRTAIGEDTHLDDMKVILKANRYESDEPGTEVLKAGPVVSLVECHVSYQVGNSGSECLGTGADPAM